MDDLNTPVAPPTLTDESPSRPRKGRAWQRAALYLLALLGLVFVALLATIYYQHRQAADQPAQTQASIDEVATIDAIMTDTYGKYSEDKRGWLHVYTDDQTYVMRVIHQVKLDDAPAGDELYFLASGTPLNSAAGTTIYGAFHVYQDPEKPGGLKQTSHQEWGSGKPFNPEDVRFAKLSKTAWAWTVKATDGDGSTDTARETVTILAPHKEQIVKLAEFQTAARYKPSTACAELERAYAEYSRTTTSEWEEEEPEEPLRCQDRRWTYKLGNTNANVPAPITITVSGTEAEQEMEEKTWKIVFDSKVHRYIVPDDLAHFRRPLMVLPDAPDVPDVPATDPAPVAEAAAPAAQ